MRHPLVRAAALALVLAVAAPSFAAADGEPIPRALSVLPSAFGEIWRLLQSVFLGSETDRGHGIDPNGLTSEPDRGHEIDPNG